MSPNEGKLSRRELLKDAAVVAAGVALGSAAPRALAQGPIPIPDKWDKEVDVVVVGAGLGLVAGVTAAVAGDKVLVLEKGAVAGGSTSISGGVLWIPNNPVMKAAGIEDSREKAMTYMKLIAQGQSEDSIIEAFVDTGPEVVDFIAKNTPIVFELWQGALCTEYHPEWPGAVTPIGRSIGRSLDGTVGGGGPLIQGLIEGLKAAGGQLMVETPAKRLITRMLPDGRQEVLGVVAENNGTLLNIKANKGVILSAGGFDWNWEMKRSFLRGPTPYATGPSTLTGDGIMMAVAAGADLRNMNECWGMPVYKAEAEAKNAAGKPASLFVLTEKAKPGVIMVNRYGERFCNEASDYDSLWRSFFTWENWGELRYRNLPAYIIMDSSVRAAYNVAGTPPEGDLPDYVTKADTLKDLATAIGVDPAGLEKTVAEWNENVEAGKDPIFHRGESLYDNAWAGYGLPAPINTLGPLGQAPFFAIEVAVADIGTSGGVRVNAKAQALTPFGEIIPRLYAAGNNSGIGGPGSSYGGPGGTLGPISTFNYIAAKDCVTLEPWEA